MQKTVFNFYKLTKQEMNTFKKRLWMLRSSKPLYQTIEELAKTHEKWSKRSKYENCYEWMEWEKGRHAPNPEELVKICMFFKVSADWLLGIDEETTKQFGKVKIGQAPPFDDRDDNDYDKRESAVVFIKSAATNMTVEDACVLYGVSHGAYKSWSAKAEYRMKVEKRKNKD